MKIIRIKPNESGAYPPLQDWTGTPPETHYAISDIVDISVFYEYNGFVIPTTDETGVVIEIQPNAEAWDDWKASLPEPEAPEQTTEEILLELVADHEARICMMELGV